MDQVAYCEHPWLNQFIIVSLYSFLICLKCFPGLFSDFIQRVQSHVSAFRVWIYLHQSSNLSFFCSIPKLLGKLSLPCFSCSYGFFRGIRTSITGLKHLYLAHELGEPTNLGIVKPTPDETYSSTSGCSTCWLESRNNPSSIGSFEVRVYYKAAFLIMHIRPT